MALELEAKYVKTGLWYIFYSNINGKINSILTFQLIVGQTSIMVQ
jgi:hypothetical protein